MPPAIQNLPEDFRAILPERKEITVILLDGILSISQPSGDNEHGIEMLELPVEDAPRFIALVQQAVEYNHEKMRNTAG